MEIEKGSHVVRCKYFLLFFFLFLAAFFSFQFASVRFRLSCQPNFTILRMNYYARLLFVAFRMLRSHEDGHLIDWPTNWKKKTTTVEIVVTEIRWFTVVYRVFVSFFFCGSPRRFLNDENIYFLIVRLPRPEMAFSYFWIWQCFFIWMEKVTAADETGERVSMYMCDSICNMRNDNIVESFDMTQEWQVTHNIWKLFKRPIHLVV